MPGDIDRFQFRANRGQQLVIETSARSLIPYLADAVPGWFQATLALYDAEGHEVAFADDFRFNPDPVLFYEVPKDGEYELEIRDSIYRGREDFIYRIAVSEQPFITQMFPIGGIPDIQVPLFTGGGLPRSGITLRLDRNAVHLRGRVLVSDDPTVGVGGAQLELNPPSGPTITADPEGRFGFPDSLPVEASVTVRVNATRFETMTLTYEPDYTQPVNHLLIGLKRS